MTLLIYFLKTVFIYGILAGYYHISLREKYFHGFNRAYLLMIPVLSFILPALSLNIPAFWNGKASGTPIRILGVGRGKLEEAITIYGNFHGVSIISWQFSAIIIWALVSIFLLFRLIRSLMYVHEVRKNKPALKLGSATIFFVTEKGTPFSFFRAIFWDPRLEIGSKEGKQILRHEIFHVTAKHSLDILLMEILSVVCWFNPFIFWNRQELKAVHEYAADAYAAAKSDRYAYASLLLQSASISTISITHPFFKNQIKRRIHMMTKSQNKSNKTGRYMILPLLAVLIAVFSFKLQALPGLTAPKNLRVVIDAGHGGENSGVAFKGIYEKDINLMIAKKVEELSKQYNIQVIMTRNKDERIGNDDLSNLEYRTNIAQKMKADLFISIHANGTPENTAQDKHTGFEIYVPFNNAKVYPASVKLASTISDFIRTDYSIASELKQREEHILVLDQATVPAILIECGFMDNQSDLNYMLDPKNQEKIARDILEGVQKYGQQNTSYTELPLQTQTTTTEVSQTPVYKKVEVEAEFPGGAKAWFDYLKKNLTYPEAAVNKEIQGQVIVEFIIKKDGTLSAIHALSGPKELRDASVQIIKNSGKWVPAKNNGSIVESYHKQPINYKLAQG